MCVSVWYGVCVVSVCDSALRVFLLFKKGTKYSQNQILKILPKTFKLGFFYLIDVLTSPVGLASCKVMSYWD